MDTSIIERPTCHKCGGKNVRLRRQISASGVAIVAWRCLDCDRWAVWPVNWIKHEYLSAYLEPYCIDDIPIIADYSDQTPCVICGEPGQLHHFAPQAWSARFGPEWHLWPCAYLCDKHHQLWHKIVTPVLTKWK